MWRDEQDPQKSLHAHLDRYSAAKLVALHWEDARLIISWAYRC